MVIIAEKLAARLSSMAAVEKTAFNSYCRKDISWALAVYEYLDRKKYDVFFDFTSTPSAATT